MRQLLLLRHAKSSWDDRALDDFDRPLAPRGRKAAERMGREMGRRGWIPQRALVSAASRTRETWEIVSAKWPRMPEVSFQQTLYAASAKQLLTEVRRTPERIETLLVLGHNPGLEDFARGLASGDSDPDALKSLQEKFPTAALGRFEFEGAWKDLRLGGARLAYCLRPKELI